jgi:hypothetical protein
MAMARLMDSPVMLSAAKHLEGHRNRPFAAAQGIKLRNEERQEAGW